MNPCRSACIFWYESFEILGFRVRACVCVCACAYVCISWEVLGATLTEYEFVLIRSGTPNMNFNTKSTIGQHQVSQCGGWLRADLYVWRPQISPPPPRRHVNTKSAPSRPVWGLTRGWLAYLMVQNPRLTCASYGPKSPSYDTRVRIYGIYIIYIYAIYVLHMCMHISSHSVCSPLHRF